MKRVVTLLAAAALVAAAAGSAGAFTWGKGELDNEALAVKVTRETLTGGYGIVTTGELKGWLDAKRELLVVDTMPAADYRRGHLPGAAQFELPCEEYLDLKPAEQESLLRILGPKKDRLLVFTCEFTRCGRSHNGAYWARQLGYTNVYRHPGGLKAWRQAGYPVEKGK